MPTFRVEKKENPVVRNAYGTVVRVKASVHADSPFKAHCKCGWWSARFGAVVGAEKSLYAHWWASHPPITWVYSGRYNPK